MAAAQDTGVPPAPTARTAPGATTTAAAPAPADTPAPAAAAETSTPVDTSVPAYQAFLDAWMKYAPADGTDRELWKAFADQITGLLKDPNLAGADIDLMIPSLDAYKQLFPGMDKIMQQGGGVMGIQNEGQYLQQKAIYQQLLITNQLPQGFYDSKEDFANWMVNGVSPKELQGRITQAKNILDSTDSNLTKQALDYYGLDRAHLMAYVLDPQKAQPLIDKQMQSIQLGGAAARQGMGLDRAAAEGLVNDYFSQASPQSMDQAFSSTADLWKSASHLADLEGTQFTQGDAIDAVIKQSQIEQRRAMAMQQREQARFSGASGGRGTVARNGGI